MTKWVWRGNGIITNNFTNRDYDLRSASNCEAIVKHLNNESERADMNLEMYNDMLTQKREVQEENKRLKKEQEALQKTTLGDAIKYGVELERENRKLKKLIKNAYESERTDLGKSVLKQLLNQMNG